MEDREREREGVGESHDTATERARVAQTQTETRVGWYEQRVDACGAEWRKRRWRVESRGGAEAEVAHSRTT